MISDEVLRKFFAGDGCTLVSIAVCLHGYGSVWFQGPGLLCPRLLLDDWLEAVERAESFPCLFAKAAPCPQDRMKLHRANLPGNFILQLAREAVALPSIIMHGFPIQLILPVFHSGASHHIVAPCQFPFLPENPL